MEQVVAQTQPEARRIHAQASPRLRTVLLPLVLAVLPFAILLWIAIAQSIANTRAAIEVNLVSQARVLAALIDNETETYTALGRAMAADPSLHRNDLDAFVENLRAAMSALPGSYATLFDDQSRALVTTRPHLMVAGRLSAIAELHARVRDTGRFIVSDLYPDAFGDGSMLSAVIAVRGAGAVERTLAISIDPSRFRALLQDKFPETVFAGIVDRQGHLIARFPDHDRYFGQPASADWWRLASQTREGIYDGGAVDGVRVIGGYASTAAGWLVGVAFRADVVEAPLNRLLWTLTGAGLLALLMSAALAALAHRRIRSSAIRLLEVATALRTNQRPASTVTGVREYDEVAQTLADAGAALRQRTEELEAGEARYRELQDAMPQLVWTADGSGRVDHFNRRRDRYFIAGNDPMNRVAIIHPDDLALTTATWRHSVATGEAFEVEHRLRLADGRWHWHLSRALPQRDAAGRVIRWFGTATDVNANRLREHEARYLLREVNHRSKNLLAIAQAMTRQTAFDEAPETMADTLCARFASLAVSQDLLLRGEWRQAALDELVREHLAHFAPVIGSRIRIDGPPVRVNATAAQAIGMALHELATNATKYGALSVETGRVDVTWSVDPGADGEDRFDMRWSESGGPAVAEPAHQGFGQFVMIQMVEQTLGGQVSLTFGAGGVVWRVDAPAVAALEDEAAPAAVQ